MNVYDFDHTIYAGDSSIDFYFFCLQKKHTLLTRAPFQVAAILGYFVGLITKERMKEIFFSFLPYIEVSVLVPLFWEVRKSRIAEWYLKQKADTDVIISASPFFLLEPICRDLGVSLIASEVDPTTGLISGRNCRGYEKVARFIERYGNVGIDSFYSDNASDLPLARLAREPYQVKNRRIEPWSFQ